MKKNMKHRVLAVSSAVLCVVAMTLSVTVLPGLAYAKITKNPLFAAVLAGFSKTFGGGALDIVSGFKHCFAHCVVSGSMLKPAVSVATSFFSRLRSDGSAFGKHTKQR